MKLILLFSTISLIHCRPQTTSKPETSGVEYVAFPNGLQFPVWSTGHQTIFRNARYLPNFLQPFNNNHLQTTALTTNNAHQHYHYNLPRYHQNPEQHSINNFSFKNKHNLGKPISGKANPKTVHASKLQEIRIRDLIETKNVSEILSSMNQNGNLAAYRAHPLFHYLKNKNTIDNDNVISFRNSENPGNVTTLILKPVARALAGEEGRAIANPISRAVIPKGANVDILFEPEAVAIAGPGGIAHAESNLEISYEEI